MNSPVSAELVTRLEHFFTVNAFKWTFTVMDALVNLKICQTKINGYCIYTFVELVLSVNTANANSVSFYFRIRFNSINI